MSLDPNVYKIRMYTTIKVLSDKIRMYKKEAQVHNYNCKCKCKLFANPLFDFIHIPRYDLHKYLHAGVENNLRTPHNLFNENWVNI